MIIKKDSKNGVIIKSTEKEFVLIADLIHKNFMKNKLNPDFPKESLSKTINKTMQKYIDNN